MLKLVKIDNANSFVQKYDYVILSPDVFETKAIFERVQFNKQGIIFDSETYSTVFRTYGTVFEYAHNQNVVKKNANGQVITPAQTLVTLLNTMPKKRSDLKILFITANSTTFDRALKMKEASLLNSLDIAIWKDLELHQLEKEEESAPDKLKITIKTHFKTDAEEIRVIFRNTETRVANTQQLYPPSDLKTQTKKMIPSQFEYEIEFEKIQNFSYLFFGVKLDRLYSNNVGIKIDFGKPNSIYNIELKDGQIVLREDSIFDSAGDTIVAPTFAAPQANEIFKYYGGQKVVPRNTDRLHVAVPKEDQYVVTKAGEQIRLVKLLGQGGEGNVYSSSKNGYVVKIIREIRRDQVERFEFFTKNKLNNDRLIWPEEVVYFNRQPVGYIMKTAKGYDLNKLVLTAFLGVQDVSIKSISKIDLIDMIIQILELFIYLHDRNVIVGDIKADNIMYDIQTKKVYFIDCDSYQIDNFRYGAVTEAFISPESMYNPTRSNTHYIDFQQEYYSIFILLYFLTLKNHPFRANEPMQRVKGEFEYANKNAKDLLSGPRNSRKLLEWAYLPQYLREAFVNTAHIDGKNQKRGTRLKPQEWLVLFSKYKKDLENGKMKAVNPDLEKSIGELFNHSNFDQYFTKVFNELSTFSFSTVVEDNMEGINLLKMISHITKLAGINNNELATILKAIRENGTYDSKQLKVDLITNLGIYYQFDYKYRS